MTDITKRLRLRTDPSQMLMCCPPKPAPDRLCYEAATKIERLQEEIQELKRDSTIFIIERGEAIGENADLREEIERLREALIEISNRNIPSVVPNGYTAFKWVIHNYGILRDAARSALEEGE